MFSDPEKNVEQLFLRDGMRVADLGAGGGAYSIAAAKRVGDTGEVYAVEVQKELLTKVKNAATEAGLDNVEVLWGDIEEVGGTKIADESIDLAIVSNVLFQAEDKSGVMQEAKRILRNGGKMLIVDWSESFGGLGPHAGDVLSKSEAKTLAGNAGFAYEKDIDAGTHHYGMIFSKT